MVSWVSVADIHFDNADHWGVQLASGINSRDLDRMALLSQSIDYAIEHKVTFFVLLGDVFNTSRPVERLKKLVFAEVGRLLENKIDVYFLTGNHEQGAFDTAYTTAEVFADFINEGPVKLHIITEPLLTDHYNDIRFLFTPWMKNPDNFLSNYDKDYDVLFGHMEIIGAKMGSHEFISKEGVGPAQFKDVHVQLGHYHKPQKIGNNIYYIGSLGVCNFGEYDHPHGFSHSTAKHDSFSDRVEVKNDFIELHDRKFIQYEFNTESSELSYRDLITEISEYEKPVVKVILHNTKEVLKSSKLIEAIKTLRKDLKELASVYAIEERIKPVENSNLELDQAGDISIPAIMKQVFTEPDLLEKATLLLNSVE